MTLFLTRRIAGCLNGNTGGMFNWKLSTPSSIFGFSLLYSSRASSLSPGLGEVSKKTVFMVANRIMIIGMVGKKRSMVTKR